MPSTLIGAQSGGVLLVSGNPYSGQRVPGIRLKSSAASSGAFYLAYSGNLTITSGGGLASGGMLDGMEVNPGEVINVPLPQGGDSFGNVFVTVAAAVSGRVRAFWAPHGPPH